MNLIVVKKVLKSKNYKMLVWVFFMLIVLASCSKDDEPEEVIYHQSYVKGKLNDTEISMNDINALVSSTKSDYNFIVRENEEKVSMFDWKVKLVDTPDSVVISCFDPIRRETARRTLEILVNDGRIQPPRIEEVFSKCQKELENELREEGEKAVFETGVGKVHPELIKIIGRLYFRTSYGQNALQHSKEVAFLAGKLAAEIGEDEILARRAGLLHDIGKASDHEVEGSHVDIGVEIATKFRENPTVIDAIASHHGDKDATTVIAHLVAAADTLSAARPGARSESLDNYIKRLQQLEDLSNEFKGVDKTYALQAGREVRVIVKPEDISDADAAKLARDIKKKIETTMNYPGTIKVTVIREVRVQEVAR